MQQQHEQQPNALEADLEYCLMQRDSAQAKADHWNHLATHVKTMRNHSIDHQNHLLVDMGEHYHLEARTDNNSEMFVHAGLSFYVPMPIHNNDNKTKNSQNKSGKTSEKKGEKGEKGIIDQFIEKQIEYWNERTAYWQKRAENNKNVILLGKYVVDILAAEKE